MTNMLVSDTNNHTMKYVQQRFPIPEGINAKFVLENGHFINVHFQKNDDRAFQWCEYVVTNIWNPTDVFAVDATLLDKAKGITPEILWHTASGNFQGDKKSFLEIAATRLPEFRDFCILHSDGYNHSWSEAYEDFLNIKYFNHV